MALYDFYFAWVANGGTTFGPVHYVNDEEIVSLEIEHQESEFPSMKIALRNPKVGLLNASRMQWAWVSWRGPDNVVVPLFHGRLLAMPTDLVMEVVSLEFTARPEDYETQKTALANTLKVAPYWDPVFIDEAQLEEPDVVLAARPVLWHVGRTDKTLTVSDILNGEAGTVVLTGAEVLGRKADISYGNPIDKVKLTATVEWTQSAYGTVDMSPALKNEFGGLVASYTGEGLERTWPLYGTQIGGGWSVDVSKPNLLNKSVEDSEILAVQLDPTQDTPDFEIEDWWATSSQGFEYWYEKAYQQWLVERMLDPVTEARFARWDFNPKMFVRYEASRGRKETLQCTVLADVQRLVTHGDEDEDVTEINATSTIVDTVLTDRAARSYFETDRGQQSIGYLLNLARCQVLMASRAVIITVDIPWSIGIQLSCRHDVLLTLPELPGGEAGGKVVGYRLSVDTNRGQMVAGVTLAAVVGLGNSLAAPTGGEESYVDESYVGADYQVFYGYSLQPVAGQIEYERPHYTPADDDIDFSSMRWDNVLLDMSATALLTFSGPGAVGNTVTIGARTYTLVDTLTGANQVLRGGDAIGTCGNLVDAIERVETREGFTFGTGTVAHADVGAIYEGAIMRATARVGGVQGNSILVGAVGAQLSWDQPHLYDGNDGLVVDNKPATQEAHVLTEPKPGSVAMAIARLNEKPTIVKMALKPVTGGPFETTIDLVTSKFMVPQTIDLSAAAT